MKKFEVGNIYGGTIKYEVTKRTKKFVTYVQIQHFGKFNEKRSEEKRARINEHNETEWFWTGSFEVTAE